MTFFSKNIKHLRESRNLTQKVLAELLEVNPNTISNYEQKKTTPSFSRLILLADFFNLSTDKLLKKDLSTIISTQKEITNTSEFSFPSFPHNNPIVPIKASAGYLTGYFQDVQPNIKYIHLPFFLFSGYKRTFEVEGNSMTPFFEEGDYVVCREVERAQEVKSCKYYVLVSKQDGISLKKVINDRNRESYLLVSENTNYEPFIRNWGEIDEIWEVKYRILENI